MPWFLAMVEVEVKISDLTEDLRGHYVIVGRGFCGVLNHVTLRASKWGKKRLGKLPVLHIGFEDPWSLYRPHRMGQARHLLDLPGFAPVIAADPADEYELSSQFAARVKSEMDRLVTSGEAELMAGWVALIQCHDALMPELADEIGKSLSLNTVQIGQLKKYSSSSPPYRLLVMEPEGSPRLVYAHKIDLCTGGGPPNLIKDTKDTDIDAGLFAAYQGKPWEPPAARKTFRYLISGIEALHATSPLLVGARLCIHGSGGVGVNLVETTLEAKKWVDWMAPGRHDEVFVASGRNHVLLKHKLSSDRWIPFHQRLRFGEGVGVAKIADGEIIFKPGKPRWKKPAGPNPPEVVDYHEDVVTLEEGGFPYGSQCMLGGAPAGEGYGQLVVTQGLDSSPERHGSPASLARAFDKVGGVEPIPLEDGRVAGLQILSGDVRILGSAATAMIDRDDPGHQALLDESETYHSSLPLQAHVGFAGITYNAVTVALANQYFTLAEPDLNRNVNTAHRRELRAVLGNEALARQIVNLRPRKAAPWGYRTLEELVDALREHPTDLPADWEERIEKLRCDYRA